MKNKIILTLLLVLALTVGIAATTMQASAAQVVAYPSELAYYDAQIDLMLPRLAEFQAQYHTVNARYYQALESHTAAPDVPTLPDGIDNSPTDQPEDLALFWDVYAELPEVLAWSFRIDTYSGPDGDGYVLTVSTLIEGAEWRRSINYGPDTWRNAEWYLVTNQF
jgi:hypothetical protein